MGAYLDFLAENRSLSAVLLLEYRSLEPEYKDLHIPLRDEIADHFTELFLQGLYLRE